MNWSNVKLIFFREVRDQLRDRRTLFMIFVLPLLMYPLLGMSFFQMAQFVNEQATNVLIMGADQLPQSPPLIEGDRFVQDFDKLLKLSLDESGGATDGAAPQASVVSERSERARALVTRGDYEAVVLFPADFSERLNRYREALTSAQHVPEVPRPQVIYNTAKEKSQLTYARVESQLARWLQEVRDQNLQALGVDPAAVRTIQAERVDVADASHRDAAVWSKIFPFLLLIWSLTGAFYPAVDLCAGEKERGTLETLLSSPADRSEIVWGKLLTVMAFSVATVLFNVLSVGITGSLAVRQLPQFGPPPALSIVWLLAALGPVSALFSALCLALAAFARSSKEGQYYLMPLVIVTLPLVMLPMAPGVELTLGNSLIPLTGVVLLLRSMIEGDYWRALPYIVPVTLVTLACCLAAIRWAVDQFNKESVLFRESERLDLALWLKHLYRDRDETPTVGAAVSCVVIILLLRFAISFLLPPPTAEGGFLAMALVTQVAVVLAPTLVLTLWLTRSPRATLLLYRPDRRLWPAAALLAVALHPAVNWLQHGVMKLYPVSDKLAEQLNRLLAQPSDPWLLLLVIAIVPAVCEELAFRGFVLSGLRHMGRKWRAIVLSSIAFGITHAVIQQSLIASLVGCVLGFMAVQCGSVWPGMLFHMLHNGLAVLSTHVTVETIERYPALGTIYREGPGGALVYQWPVALLGLTLALWLLAFLQRLPYQKTAEELLEDSIARHDGAAMHSLAG